MARYPGAVWVDVGSGSGDYKGGPLKIVHHTTEGPSAEAAFSAYRSTGCFPQFTVDAEAVYQHLDTMTAGSALRNESGGVETNRDGAIQIEVVTYAGSHPKNAATLERVAQLCRWIEETHCIPAEWPNGPPRYGSYDPGGHNKNADNWNNRGGHYGHSQVPEQTHWDPSYWPDEFETVMGEAMQPVRIFINDSEMTGTVKAWLADANSIMDVSDWCAYSRTPAPVFDNSTKDEEFAGTLSLWTAKTTCQAFRPDGSICGQPAQVVADVPLPGSGTPGEGPDTVREAICAEHWSAMATGRKPRKKKNAKP